MRIDQPHHRRQLSLLLAALLLLSNALVTAHAFGDAQHAVQDECRLLHQFERELQAPAGLPATAALPPPFLPLSDAAQAPIAAAATVHFQPRAPPLA